MASSSAVAGRWWWRGAGRRTCGRWDVVVRTRRRRGRASVVVVVRLLGRGSARATWPPAAGGARLRPARRRPRPRPTAAPATPRGGRRASKTRMRSRALALGLDRRERRLEVRDALVRRDLGLARREPHEPRRHGAQRPVGGLGPELASSPRPGGRRTPRRRPRRRARARRRALLPNRGTTLEERRLPEALGLGPRQRDDDDGPRRRRRERQEQRREERLAVAAAALARRDGEGLDLEDVVDAAAVDRDLCCVCSDGFHAIDAAPRQKNEFRTDHLPRPSRRAPRRRTHRRAAAPARAAAAGREAVSEKSRRAAGWRPRPVCKSNFDAPRHRRDRINWSLSTQPAHNIKRASPAPRARRRGAREVGAIRDGVAAVTRTTASPARGRASRFGWRSWRRRCAPLVAAETGALSR